MGIVDTPMDMLREFIKYYIDIIILITLNYIIYLLPYSNIILCIFDKSYCVYRIDKVDIPITIFFF